MDLSAFLGRQEIAHDRCDEGRVARLAATLDHATPPWAAGVVPPLGHWLCFVPSERQSQLGEDGHALRTGEGMLPNVDLPRRMWVGSRIEFRDDVPLGQPIVRTSTLIGATAKQGRSGQMVFATMKHEIGRPGQGALIVEEQDIVYREAAASGVAFTRAAEAPGESDPTIRSIRPDPTMLFRYSALTFNSHRIHYDRDYATSQEGYPGLVIHGPLAATLLLDHLVRSVPGARVRAYRFRALSPLIEGDTIELGLRIEGERAELRAIGPVGVAMIATAEIAA